MMDQQPPPRVDRRLVMAVAGLGGVVLGLVLLVTLFGGGSDPEAVDLLPQSPPAGEPGPTVPETTPPDVAVPPAVPERRDPFRQVVVPDGVQTGEAPQSGQAPESGQGSGFAQGPPAPTSPPLSPEGTEGNAILELKSISTDDGGVTRATITVDGEPHSPAGGEVFAYGVRLEGIDGNCVEVSAQGERARMCLPAGTAGSSAGGTTG